MSKKYYIRISEDEPLEDEKGLTFELTTYSDQDNYEWLLITENQYNSLIDSLEGAIENFTESQILEDAINAKVENMELVVPMATNATYIKHPDRNTKYSYSDLVSNFNSIDSQLSSLDDSKADVGDISSLSSRISDVSSTLYSHNHDSMYYTEGEIDDKFAFKHKQTISTNSNKGNVLVFANAYLVYVVLEGTFKTTADATTTLGTKITEGYAPASTVTTWANINSGIGRIAITSGGSISLYSSTTALNVHTSVVYPNLSQGIG